MWGIHDEIRKKMKEVLKLIDEGKISEEAESIPRLIVMLGEMVFKEENILFPAAMNLLSDKDWDEIRKGEKDIGFAFIGKNNNTEKSDKKVYQNKEAGFLNLSTGVLSLEQLDSILTTLPVDISFVDENDEVKYYSDNRDRIFPRSPGVIGRKVQMCHPQKSVYIVEKILDAFKKGEKNVAEFYIKLNGRDIHIRYFAVRDKNGRYMG
ncbi:MAG: PAS domain-containing protein, partial [Deltaproteobacteria bacterium]|nr:PAS domain-containing protein [Deltaproteobacteria bacterium]